MNPLPWIQLGLTLVTPLIVLAVAWGRLNERDRARETTDKSILDGIKELNGKFDDLRAKTAAHDTNLAVQESAIAAIRVDLAALKTSIDANVSTDRQLRHEMREQFQRLHNDLELRLEQHISQTPPPPPRRR